MILAVARASEGRGPESVKTWLLHRLPPDEEDD
jgi:hypothetical protein